MNRILALLLVLSLLLSGCVAGTVDDPAQVVIRGRTGDSTYQVPRVDSATHVIEIIEYEHHEIHAGNSYFVCDVVDLGNAANRTFIIITPNTTTWAHILFEIEMELEASIMLYEGATLTVPGTPMSEFNRDRNSIKVASVVLYHTPIVSADGTLLHGAQLGSGKKDGGGARSLNEFILRQNTNYVLRITNQTNTNNIISTRISWYEHTNRSP